MEWKVMGIPGPVWKLEKKMFAFARNRTAIYW
jgi:hypothetical protein